MKIMTGLLQRVNYFWAEDQSSPHISNAICLGLFKLFMSNINDWEDKIYPAVGIAEGKMLYEEGRQLLRSRLIIVQLHV